MAAFEATSREQVQKAKANAYPETQRDIATEPKVDRPPLEVVRNPVTTEGIGNIGLEGKTEETAEAEEEKAEETTEVASA